MKWLKTRNDIQCCNLEEAKKYYTVTQLKSHTAHVLIEQGFTEGKNLYFITSVDRAFMMLQSGRGDLIGYPELVMYYTVRNRGLNPETTIRKVYCFDEVSELYAAFSLQTSKDIVKRFQAGLNTVKENGTYQKILEKYLN